MEKNLTIGIAGHVDHGKTTLVRSLTGTDTDRMKEEKLRGVSIETGIAPLILRSGAVVSIVDVPGHTDFIKNTVRGLNSVDAGILIIAANDGVMPQTREHLEILRYFGINDGFVVLSKSDLVDEDTLELAAIETSDLVRGTFLEERPVIPFSGIDLRGIESIIDNIEILLKNIRLRKSISDPFRFFIDQVRSLQGLGTVVSGTVSSGKVRKGDTLQIMPSGQTVRIRSIQTHHKAVDTARAGERAGINIQGVSLNDVSRGMALIEPGTCQAENLVNADIEISACTGQTLKSGQKVKVFIGTASIIALAVLIGKDELIPGEKGVLQLRLNEPEAILPGDCYVIMPMNSHEILGGGRVLETTKRKYRRVHEERTVSLLSALQAKDPDLMIKALVSYNPFSPINSKSLASMSGLDTQIFDNAISEATSRKELVCIGGSYICAAFIPKAKDMVVELVERKLRDNKDIDSLSYAFIAQAMNPSLDPVLLETIIRELASEGRLFEVNGLVTILDIYKERDSSKEHFLNIILSAIENSRHTPVLINSFMEDMQKRHSMRDIRKALDHLVFKGELIRLDNDRLLSKKGVEDIKSRVRGWIDRHGRLRPSDCNDVFGYGRTVGLVVFEYLDSIGFTQRNGNERILKRY